MKSSKMHPGVFEMKTLLNPSLYRHLVQTQAAFCRDCQRQISSNTSNKMKLRYQRQMTPQSHNSLFFSYALQSNDVKFKHIGGITRLCTVANDNSPPKSKLSQLNKKRTIGTSKVTSDKIDQAGHQDQRNVTATASLGEDEDPKGSTEENTSGKKKPKKVLKITPRMRKPNPSDYSYTGNKN